MPDFGVSFVQASSDATRRLCEQGQSVAKTIGEWNTEVNHFFSHRVARNGETLGRMTKCQNLPEVFAIQAAMGAGSCGRLPEGDEQADGGQQQDHERHARVCWSSWDAFSRRGCQRSPRLRRGYRRCALRIRDTCIARGALGTRDTDPASDAFITGKVDSEGRRLAVGTAGIPTVAAVV